MNREPIEVRLYGAAGAVGNATAQVITRSGNAAVVLLHGGPGAPSSVADLARELASDFHVLEPLQRRASVTPLTVQRHVDDLAAIAPDYAAIVGHSWGAMLALSYAARHPRRVRSLTLIGCGTYDADTRAAYRKAVERRLTPDDRAGIDEIGQQLAAVTDQTSRDRFFAEFGQIFNRVDSFDPLPHTPTSLSPDECGFNETWPDVLRLQESGIEPAAFSSIVAPTLMLHGDDDPHPGPAIRDTLIRHIPHLQYIELPRCGHHPWRERHAREPFLNALREWITQNSTGRQG